MKKYFLRCTRQARSHLLFLILLIALVSTAFSYDQTITGISYQTVIYSESFPYSDSVVNYNWAYSNNGCGGDITNIPKTSPFSTKAYSYNGSSPCAGYTPTIERVLPGNYTSGTYTFQFDYAALNNSATHSMIFELANKSGSTRRMQVYFDNAATNSTRVVNTIPGGQGCTLNITKVPYTTNVILSIDLNNGIYAFYRNGSAGECFNKALGSLDQLSTIKFFQPMSGAGVYKQTYMDNLFFGIASFEGGVTPITTCSYPLMFCDDFNYDTPMQDKEWLIYTGPFSIDPSFTPTDNKLKMLDSNLIQPVHTVGIVQIPTQYQYLDGNGNTITGTELASQFSNIFSMNLSNNCLGIRADDRNGRSVYNIQACTSSPTNISWSYFDSSGIERVIGGNKTKRNLYEDIQIVTSFSNKPAFAGVFNSTFTNDTIEIAVNNESIGSIPINDINADRVHRIRFIKSTTSLVELDDYYMMIGTDKFVDTTRTTQSGVGIKTSTSGATVGQEGDFTVALNDFYVDMGLISFEARVTAGLGFLLFFLVALNFAALAGGVHLNLALNIIIGLLISFILVYVKLFPIWIPILFFIMGIGAVLLLLRRETQG